MRVNALRVEGQALRTRPGARVALLVSHSVVRLCLATPLAPRNRSCVRVMFTSDRLEPLEARAVDSARHARNICGWSVAGGL